MIHIEHVGDKVIPKHIGHLVGHEGDVEIPLNASQLILQTGVILGCARRHDILDPAHLIYYFKEGGLAQVQEKGLWFYKVR